MSRTRKPRPAAHTTSLPRFDRLARLLAAGSFAAITGCRGVCPLRPGEERIPAEQRPWWARIYSLIGCDLVRPIARPVPEATFVTGGVTAVAAPEMGHSMRVQGGISRVGHAPPHVVPPHHRERIVPLHR